MRGLAQDVAGAVESPSVVSRYLKAYKQTSETFTIYWPDGKPILCQKPRRYGSLKDAYDLAGEWYKQLMRPDLETDHPLLFQAVQDLGDPTISIEEAVASFFIRHFCVEPRFTDVQSAEIIGCPQLLEKLFDQINEEVSASERLAQISEVNSEGEASGGTTGDTKEPLPAKTLGS